MLSRPRSQTSFYSHTDRALQATLLRGKGSLQERARTANAQARERKNRISSVMKIPTSQLKGRFKELDRAGRGSLSVPQLEALMRSLGASTSHGQLLSFTKRIAQHRRSNQQELYITLEEFVNNRGALITADSWRPGTTTPSSTRAPSRIQNLGLPPKKVSNACYSGTAEDYDIGQQLLKNTTKFIMCPGVEESSWRLFQSKVKGQTRDLPNAKAFPEALTTHSMRDSKTETGTAWPVYPREALKRRKPFSYKATIAI